MTPARNRVTPTGDIEAIPLRGAWTGNRGILHVGHDIVRFHASDLWITCALEFRGRWRAQWQPHRYTYLFFHDEAVSLAAGHRPCAECRRPSYNAYRAAFAEGLGVEIPTAAEMNRQLHSERIVRGTHRRRLHRLHWVDLPDGTFVCLQRPPASSSAITSRSGRAKDITAARGARSTAWRTFSPHPQPSQHCVRGIRFKSTRAHFASARLDGLRAVGERSALDEV